MKSFFVVHTLSPFQNKKNALKKGRNKHAVPPYFIVFTMHFDEITDHPDQTTVIS